MDDFFGFISKAATLSSNAGKQISQDLLEKSKEAAITGYYYDTAEDKISAIRPKLDSRFDKDKIDALKRLIAMTSKGIDVSEVFIQSSYSI